MAGAGYRNWTAGDIPTAAQFDTFLQEQVVGVYADAAARDTALSVVKAEGMLAYLLSSNTLTVYTGSVWSTVGPVHGALLSWTPVITQGATPSLTNLYSDYSRVGRRVFFETIVSTTSAGTAANDVVVSLPVAAATLAGTIIGRGQIQDVAPGSQYEGPLLVATSTTCKIGVPGSSTVNTFLGTTQFTLALASGDVVRYHGSYEAAADA